MSAPPAYPSDAFEESTWTLSGSEGLPLFGKTTEPPASPRAVAIVVHGYTGHLDRNIVPVAAQRLAAAGCLVHRFNLGHCGILPGEDRITRLDLFETDSIAHSMTDIRAVVRGIDDGVLDGGDLPQVLLGHSRGGPAVLGAAVRSIRDEWPRTPKGVITLATIGRYARTSPELLERIEKDGFIEREAARADGGAVRIGRSWYEHELDAPGGDPFPSDLATLSDTPVEIIHGDADSSVPVSESQRVRDLLQAGGNRRVGFELVSGADHNFSAKGVLGEDLRWDRQIGERFEQTLTRSLDRILQAG